MTAARHVVLTEAEANALASLLLKLTKGADVDEPPKPVVQAPEHDPDRRARIEANVLRNLKRQGKL